MDRFGVFVYSRDPVLEAGIAALFRTAQRITIVADLADAAVVVVATDRVDEETVAQCRNVSRCAAVPVVVVTTFLDEADLIAGIEAGARSFLRRAESRPDRLISVVEAASAGDGSVPADLLGTVMNQWTQLRAQVPTGRGITLSGFTQRELEVLKLVADGMENSEIAQQLCYSERTVKGVIHEITTRFQLKNRAQAVAYAVRQGVI